MCTYNKTVTQGELWTATWEFNNPDGTEFSLATYTEVHIQVRKTPGSAVVMEGTLTDGEFTKSGNLLTVNIDVPTNISGNYKYDIDLIKANGDVWTPISGTLKIRPQITIQTA
ncbi:MAG TPA: hypothetical protein PKD14_11405 [Saprospiraceae bacterium]|nr:hypothetical protein [Saprospiraceae bacterium]